MFYTIFVGSIRFDDNDSQNQNGLTLFVSVIFFFFFFSFPSYVLLKIDDDVLTWNERELSIYDYLSW